ncbi:hypothetical protein LUCX_86 [Xanthomonas phage vB_XciM_LucasX]|nr:hypothetical protein LUCX_86 [Xanthomonas phage vB_XciM_LucasX]
MKNPKLPQISMEALNYQGRSTLLFDLTSVILLLRQEQVMTQAVLDRSGLAEIVQRRTKMQVRFYLEEGVVSANRHQTPPVYSGCYGEPPVVDANNPFYKLLIKSGQAAEGQGSLHRHQAALRLASNTLGSVNLKSGEVQGIFSSLISRVWLDDSIVHPYSTLTPEEAAVTILHELGHLFSFFETMAYSVASNMIISTAVEALREVEDQEVKVRLIAQSYSPFGIKPADANAIASSEPDVARSLLLKSFEEIEQSRVKSSMPDADGVYNCRSIEFMADQYAIRHGGAVALASAAHKLAKLHTPDYGKSSLAFYATQALRYGLVASGCFVPGLIPLTLIVTALCSFLCASEAIDADATSDPSERLGLIKKDLVQVLKNTRLDAKLRKQILQDVEVIDQMRAEVKEHSGLFRFVWRNVIPAGRRQSKIREFQQGLEELINNDLFIKAHQLKVG